MKYLKIVIAITTLLLASQAWGAISFLGGASSAKACGTTGTCASAQMSSTAGNTEIVVASFYDAQGVTPHVTSISDNAGDASYTNLLVYQPSNKVFVEVWYVLSITNTVATTFQITVNSTPTGTGTSMGVQFLGYSGVAAINANNPQTGFSSANATSASFSLTTNDANNFVIGAFADHPANAFTVSGCTQRNGNISNGGGSADLDICDNTAASPSSVSVGVTFSAAVWSGAAIELCTVNPCVATSSHIRHQVITN